MGILKIPWENFFPVGILKIPTGFFSHIIKWDFFPTGKIRKNKMCVDIYFYQNSEIIPIFQYLYFPVGNFFQGNFFPFCNMGKNPMGFFDFLKLLISEKI